MKRLTEYLLMFVIFLIFLPNDYLVIYYIAINGVILLLYLPFYFINKKHNKEKEQFDIGNVLNAIFIVAINLIVKAGYTNLIFAYLMSLYFLITMLICFFKKDYGFDRQKFHLKYLLDLYLLGALIELIILKM